MKLDQVWSHPLLCLSSGHSSGKGKTERGKTLPKVQGKATGRSCTNIIVVHLKVLFTVQQLPPVDI